MTPIAGYDRKDAKAQRTPQAAAVNKLHVAEEVKQKMELFQAQVHLPFSDDQVTVADAMMIVVTARTDPPTQQPLSQTFGFVVTENTILVETIRGDGREVFARLQFDGQQFILLSEGRL
jgi:hypothetical protein